MPQQVSKHLCLFTFLLLAGFSVTRASNGGGSANAGPDQVVCTESATLEGNSPIGQTGIWSIVAGNASFQDTNLPDTEVSDLNPGENILVWEFFIDNILQSSDTVVIQFVSPPIVSAGTDQEICSDSTRLNASLSAGSGIWEIIEGAANLSDVNNPEADLLDILPGQLVLSWNVSQANCPVQRDTVFIQRDEIPLISAGEDLIVCTDSIRLNASLSAGSGTWSLIEGSASIESPGDANSDLTEMQVGFIQLQWSVVEGSCPAIQDTLNIEVLSSPTVDAGEDQIGCDSVFSLDGSSSVSNTLWELVSGNAIILESENLTSSVTVPSGTVAVLSLRANVPGCPAISDSLSITSIGLPLVSAGADRTICGQTAVLEGFASAGTGQWNILSGNAIITDPANPQSSITVSSSQLLTLEWVVNFSVCSPQRDTVELNFIDPPIVSAGADQQICGSQTQLNATTTSGTGTWTFISGSGVLENSNDPTSQISSLSPGTSSLVWSVSSNDCAIVNDTLVLVSEVPFDAEAGNDQEICSSTAALSATPALGGFWEIISGTGVIQSVSSAVTSISGLSAGITLLQWVVPNAICPASRDTLQITVVEAPATANAGENQSICSTTTILEAQAVSVGSGQWTVISGNAVFTDANNPITSVSALLPGDNVLRWTVSNGVCPVSFDEVTISVDSNPETAEAGENQQVCSTTTILDATPANAGIGTWTLVSGSGVIVAPNNPATQVVSLAPGNNVFRWTISGGACGNVFDEVAVTRFATPTVSAAGPDQTVCATSAVLQGNEAITGLGLWSVVSGTAVFEDLSDPQTSISGLSPGVNTLQWSITNGVCPPSTDEVNITVELPADAPDAGSDQTLCSATATLNALSGTGGTWSLVSGSGNIISPTSATTNITGLGTGTNVFRWTVSGGSCGSSFDEVSIIRFALPSEANAGSDQDVCGSTATLSATQPVNGTGSWTVLAGTGVVANANSALTTVSGLSNGLNSFRWLVSNGPCSPSADEVNITAQLNAPVANAGSDQSVCNSSATLSATSATGGFWTVVSGTGQVANASLFNTSVSGMSAGNNVFRWNVPAGACGNVSDEVTINVQTQPSQANAGSDQNICSTVANLQANSPLNGTGLWSLVQGTGVFNNASNPFTEVSGLSTGTNVLRWTISNGVCPTSSDDVVIVVDSNPVTPQAGSDQQICASSASISASPAGGNWSVINGSGVFSDAGSANTTVSGLSSGTNRLRWTVSAGACGTVFDDVIIAVSQPPSSANAGVNQEICATFTNLNAIAPLTGTGQWTVITGNGIFENATSPSSGVSGLLAGQNTFRWTVSSGSCPANSDDVIITVQENPLNPNAGPDQTICSSSTQLAATPFAGGFWTLVSGTATIQNPSSASSAVSGLGAGLNVFSWTIPGGACNDVSDQVSVLVQANPSVANAGPDQQICATVTTLEANTPLVGNGSWSLVSGSGTLASSSSSNTTVSGLSPGLNVFRWTISNGVCNSSVDEVTVTVDNNPLSPNAGLDQTICSGSTQLSATPAPGGTWTLVSGTGTISNPNVANSIVSGLAAGPNVFRWTIPGGTCGSVSDLVTITVDAQPTVSSAGENQTICIGESGVFLEANQAITGTGIWSVVSGSGSFSNASDPQTFVSGLAPGNNVFRWTISNGVCPSSNDEIVVQADPQPVTPNAGPDQVICSAGTQLNATAVTGASWSILSGSASINNPSQANSILSGLSPGTITLAWTVSGGSCPDAFDVVNIVVQAPPTTAIAGPDQQICSTTASLNANLAISGSGFWTLVSGNGVIADPTQANTQVGGLSPGSNVFRWTISNGVCAPSFDEVNIVVDDNPVSPNAGADQNVCSSTAQLNAIAVTGGSWSIVSGSGSITNAALANTTVTGLSAGLNVFRWTISGGSCPEASDDVVINVQTAPTTANAGVDQTICLTSTQLNANTPVIGTGVWTVVSGTATFVNAQQANTNISGLSAGTNVLRWTISNGVCSPSVDDVTIVVEQTITEPDAGPDQTICGNTAVLSASPASGGTWSIVSGSGTFANPQNANSSISGLGSGLNVFRWTVQSGVCPLLSDDVSIIVSISPTTANAGPNQTLCSASTVLAANTPSTGNGQWSVISGSGFFSNASQANSTVSGMGPGLNVFRWTISNGICPPSIDDVQVTVLSAPVAFAGQDQSVCGSSTVLEASAAQAGVGTWTVVSGGASFADSQSATSAVSALQPGVNVLRWTVVNGSCPAAFDEVTIQSFVQVNQPDAGLDQTICSTETQLNASAPLSGQGIWSVVSGAGLIADPTNPLTSVSSLLSGANVFRFTVSNGICPPVSDEITVTVLSQPQANAGVDFGVCAGSASLAASLPAGAGGQWQLISGSAFIQNISSPTTLVSNLGIGQNVFLWTVSNGVCDPATDQITLTRFEEPSPANAGNDFQTCATGAQLNAEQPTVGTGFWSVLSGNGNFSNPTLPNSGVSQLAVGANVLLWTVSNGACPASSDELVITVDQNPTSADAGPDQSLCTDQTVLDATQPAAGVGVWTVLNGTATISNPGNALSSVSGLGQGSTTLRWTVTNGTCVSFDDVQIIRSLPPSSAIAGEDRQVCTDTVHLQANTPLIGSGSWSVLSGSASVQNLNSPNTTITSLSAGANVFVWTISNGACEPSIDQVTVIRQTPPEVADAGANQQICDESTTLSANLPLVGTGIWSVISGSATIENAFNPNTTVSGLSPGQNVLRWTTLNGICPASNDDVEVFRATLPSPAAAGEDALVCGTTASLNAESPSSGSGAWVLIAGTAQIDDENDPQTGLSNLLPGTVQLVWQVSSSPCPLNVDTVQLTVASQTPQANAGIDIETCSNSTLLFGNNTAGGIPLWALISGDLNIVNPSGQITNINSIEPGVNILEYSISNAHCISRDTIHIIRYISEPFVFAGNDTTVCQEELQLQGSEANFGVGIWEILSGEASIDDTGTGQAMLSFITDTVSLSWTVGNNFCPLVADTIILIRQTPTQTALAMDNATICGTEILIEASPAISGNGWWVIIAGDGVIEDTASASTTLFSQSTGEFIIAWVLQEGACLSADTVNLVSEEPPFPVYAGEDQQLCGNSTQLNASVPELGNGFWSTLSGGFFSDPNDPQSGFITPNSGFRALVWNVSNGACTLRDTVFIDMIEAPNADAGADLTGCLGDTVYLQAEIPDFGDGLWTLLSAGAQVFEPAFQNSGFVADSAGNYYLRWKVVNGICADSTILTITMLDKDHPDCIGSSDNVFVPEGFSPNGDGVFDQFVIVHNPEKQIEFKVYDRRGVLIYQSMDYQNDWAGESEEGTILIDGKLPEGTYFYLLKVEDDFEYRKGYFTLWR